MFGQQVRLRRLAAHVLFVWLFALTSSIANACVMEPGLRHAPLATTDRHDAEARIHRHEHDVRALGHEHPEPPDDKAPCAKFCDEQSASAPTVKRQMDLLSVAWPAPPPYVSGPLRALRGSDRAFDAEHGTVHARIPIPIAFLRLTL